MTTKTHVGFTALTALPLFSRTYSRWVVDSETGKKRKETPQEAIDRAIRGLDEFELLTEEEVNLIKEFAYRNMVFVSGRWLWVGGTPWVKQQKNFIGAYNCAALAIDNWETLDFNFQALLMGCGVGTVVELDKISKLPSILYSINVVEATELGTRWEKGHPEFDDSYFTAYKIDEDTLGINYVVGDSKEGWVDVATDLLRFSSLSVLDNKRCKIDFPGSLDSFKYKQVSLRLDLSYVRKKDITLEGFGGKSNPDLLEIGLRAIIDILNGAVGRQLNSLEVVLISNWAGAIAVSGNIRRSAKIQLISFLDKLLATAKDNLWTQDEKGNWKIDPKKDVLRLSNHTLTYHLKPNLETVVEAVRKQYYSGEGAIQFVPEAVARSSADLLDTNEKKKSFIALYCDKQNLAQDYLKFLAENAGIEIEEKELEHRMDRYFLNPCGEIIGNTFLCNLADVHANMLDPHNLEEQDLAFKASTLAALPLLKHEFEREDFRYSREIDPIIGVCITGLFDFFVHLFGEDWLVWWKTGRDKSYKNASFYLSTERAYLERWKNVVKDTVTEFCTKHGFRVPSRYTSIAPSGSKSLLTGASPGWHPPKDTRFIRRITYSSDSPVAQACADYGYKVIPSQSCKDENGNLLDDINDPRVNEVLVEIPIEVSWAELADNVDFKPKDIPALAQLDFYMQVQKFYTNHNTSSTIELREDEIEPLGRAIYDLIQNDEGYISSALLARFDALETFPRLPFEPISLEQYLSELEGVKQRQMSDDFLALVNKYSTGESSASEQGPAGCDSDKCLMPERK